MLSTNDLKTRFSLVAEDIAASIDRLVATILAATRAAIDAAGEGSPVPV